MRLRRTANARLGITWIHGRLDMALVRPRGETRAWSAPSPVHDLPALGEALREGLRHLDTDQRRATLALDQRNIIFHLQEAPPARGKMLDQVLERLVAEQQFFAEPAAITRAATGPQPGKNRWLLAVLPKSFLAELVDTFAFAGLRLTGIHPVATLLASLRPRATESSETPDLTVTHLGESCLLVIAGGRNDLWFARSLHNVEQPSGSRLEQEIHRTLQFARQRFGTSIGRIIWQSDSAQQEHTPPPRLVEPGIEWIDPPSRTLHLAETAARMEPDAPLNFAAAAADRARRNREPAAWPAIAALLVALAFAATVEVYRYRALSQASRLDREQAARSAAETKRLSRRRESDQLTRFLSAVQPGTTNSLAVNFARRLPQTTPPSLRLSRALLSQGTNGWEFTLEGATRVQGSQYLGVVEDFEKRLEQDTVPCRVLNSTARETLSGTPAVTPPSPLSRSQGMPPRSDERPWFVSGVLR